MITPYPSHPLSLAFPPIPEAESVEAIESIKETGQIEDIVLATDPADGQTKVLDGTHRQKWCIAAGVQPRYRSFGSRPSDGASPTTYVWTMNVQRRHLPDTNVRSAIAAALQKSWLRESNIDGADVQECPAADIKKGEAITKAADAMNVGERSVRKAIDVMEHAPEEFEKLKAGETSLAAASAVAEPLKEAAAADKPKKPGRPRKSAPAAATKSNPLADKVRATLADKVAKEISEELGSAIRDGAALLALDDMSAFDELPKPEAKALAAILTTGKPLAVAQRIMSKTFDKRDKLEELIMRAFGSKGEKFACVVDGYEIKVSKVKEAPPPPGE